MSVGEAEPKGGKLYFMAFFVIKELVDRLNPCSKVLKTLKIYTFKGKSYYNSIL